MQRVGVVGAGAAAAALASVLDAAAPDAEVTVLEAAESVGGRAATRRHGDLTYDHGANYLTSADDRASDLVRDVLGTEGLVEVTERTYTFDREGTVSPGRAPSGRRWSHADGLAEIPARLLRATDATVRLGRRVERLARDEGAGEWTLRDADGVAWGPFDAVVVTPPAPVTADLLRTAAWDDPAREALVEAAAAVSYRAVWSAALHYRFRLDRPYYALVNVDDGHDVGWIAREECKPGHVPDGETLLVVQSSDEWARERAGDPPGPTAAALATAAADVVGDDRLRDPHWTDGRLWRHALPEAGVRRGPLSSAESAGLYAAGDWVAGEARLHAALRSGLDVGERLTYAL